MPMTCIFDMDVEKFSGNPHKADTPFGRAVIVSKGDMSMEVLRLRVALEEISEKGDIDGEIAAAALANV